MKSLLDFKPLFDPATKTMDFSLLPNFSVSKIYAIINVTRNTPIYIPGASGFGISSVSGSVITLSYDTTSHASTDIINVFYNVENSDSQVNLAIERGGNLENISETLTQILTELQVHSIILLEHLHKNSLTATDLQRIRDDINNINAKTNF
jgi:hypothetical protein